MKFKKYKDARELVDKYLKLNSNNESNRDLWLLSLRIKLEDESTTSENETEVLELFKRALGKLKEKETLDMWRRVLAWFDLNKCKNTEKLFEVGLLFILLIFDTFKKKIYFYIVI